MSAAKRFGAVYARAEWATNGVLSGNGSRLENCERLVEWLEQEAELGATRVCDLGCGDLEWIARVPAITQGRMNYWGVDAVRALVEHHQRVFPWFRGEVEDLEGMGSMESAERAAPIVLLKDVMHHLCSGAAEQILLNLSRWTGWRLLLVSTHAGANNRLRRGLRGAEARNLDVEAMCTKHGLEMGPITKRFPRPDGGEWIVFERPAV